jgi:hypothetical protein
MVGVKVKYGRVIPVCDELREFGLSSRLRRPNALFRTFSNVAARANPVDVAFRNLG